MSNITLEIPAEFARSFGATDEEAARNAQIKLAIQIHREGKCSTGRAGRFCEMARLDFMDLLRDRKVETPYTLEMLEQDFAYARSRAG